MELLGIIAILEGVFILIIIFAPIVITWGWYKDGKEKEGRIDMYIRYIEKLEKQIKEMKNET